MVWKPHVTVAALIEDNEGRFLMVEEQVGGRTVLNQPAGHLEPGESLLDAVRRETLEETAWTFEPQSLIGVYRWENPANGETFLRAAFSGRATAHHGERSLDADILRTLWLTPAEIEARAPALRSPMVWRCIADYAAGRGHPLDVCIDL